MAFDVIQLVRRTLYISQCPTCESREERAESPPRERFCQKCGTWVPFVAESYTGG